MTKRELIEGFLRGDVDRRQFINRLTMLGVSGGAAVAYAASLGGSPAVAHPQSVSGFTMRAQVTDDDYGTAIIIELIEALQLALSIIEDLVLAILDLLALFVATDFADGVFGTLQTIDSQQREHAAALNGLLGAAGGTALATTSARMQFRAQETPSPDEFLASLADAFDELTKMYAAVVPGLQGDVAEVGEARQTFMEVASVANRHAALANLFAGRDPSPESFQTPEVPQS
jgi:hypothetical protein